MPLEQSRAMTTARRMDGKYHSAFLNRSAREPPGRYSVTIMYLCRRPDLPLLPSDPPGHAAPHRSLTCWITSSPHGHVPEPLNPWTGVASRS